MEKKQIILSHLLLVLMFFFYSCVPNQEEKEAIGGCFNDEVFDPLYRECVPGSGDFTPPFNTLRLVDMVEDIPLNVILTYTDRANDFATACEVSDISVGLNAMSSCQCVGGFCSITLVSDSNYYGYGEFTYHVTDDDGNSKDTLVSVIIEAVDDPPTLTGTLPFEPIIFDEDTSVTVYLQYDDVEGDLGNECDVTIQGTNSGERSAYIEAGCICSPLSGECFFTMAGIENKYTAPGETEYFNFKIKSNNNWSDSRVASYRVTSVSDSPTVENISMLSSADEPIDSTVPWTTDFVISYKDGDDEAPSLCQLSWGVGVAQENICICHAPVSGAGTCDITLKMDVGYEDHNVNTANTTNQIFQYIVALTDPSSSLATLSPVQTVSVSAGNDAPIVMPAYSFLSSPYRGDEDVDVLIVENPGIRINEGGEVDEDGQNVYVKLEVVNPADELIFPSSGMSVYYGGLLATPTAEGWWDLGDGINPSQDKDVGFLLVPGKDQTSSSGVDIKVLMKDSEGRENINPPVFTVILNEVSDDPVIKVRKTISQTESYIPYYDTYRDAPTCDDSDTTAYKEDCVRNLPPDHASVNSGSGIVPDKLGQIFYDYNSGLRYVSYGTANKDDWIKFITTCPFSNAVEELSCARAASDYLHCVGNASPSSLSITPQNTGKYFYDYVNDMCYVSSTSSTGSISWGSYDLYPTSTEPYFYDSSGSGAPSSSLITSTSSGNRTIYKNTDNSKYYVGIWDRITSTGSWTEFATNCPFSKVSCSNKYFSKVNCIGTDSPRKNTYEVDNIIPQAIGLYYYDIDDDICYTSVGTNSADDWVIYGNDLPDLKQNENGILVMKNLLIDEGGDSSEDSETITVQFKILTNDTSDANGGIGNDELLEYSGIKVYCDGVEVPASVLANPKRFILDMVGTTCLGAEDDKFKNVEFHFEPVKGEYGYGRSEIELTLFDSGGSSTKKYFSLLVYPIAANHKGWTNLKAKGDQKTRVTSMALDGDIIEDISVELSWESFSLGIEYNYDYGPSLGHPIVDPARVDYRSATITGYHVYRRMAGERFDFSRPINSILIDPNVRSFIDKVGNTKDIPGPPRPGTVYYYTVRGIDSLSGLHVTTEDIKINNIRVVAPPDNMVFVHRWLVNKEMCDLLNSTDTTNYDQLNNYRCPYLGPGVSLDASALPTARPTGTPYYDIGYDLLVDRQEAGCPYGYSDTDCAGGGCVAISDSNPIGDTVYYSRESGKCYINNVGTWETFNETTILNKSHAFSIQRAHLPPLVYVSQNKANEICKLREKLNLVTSSGTIQALSDDMTLPSRKEQIGYSAWLYTNEVNDSIINSLETGLSLNSSSKCNSSQASGLNGFSNEDIPSYNDFYSLPGSLSSTIRSLITGSGQTNSCESRYGVQDFAGNVKEWTEDRIRCEWDGFSCKGVYPGYNPDICRFSSLSELTNLGLSDCTDTPTGDCVNVNPPTPGVLVDTGGTSIYYYDRLDDTCYSRSGAATWAQVTVTPTVFPTALNDSYDFLVGDELYFHWALDGRKGPCITSNGICSSPIDSWSFYERDYSSSYFIAPLGLLSTDTFRTDFGTSAVNDYFLEIGPSSGISQDELHDDYFSVESDQIRDYDPVSCGAMNTGGSYLSGSKAGRYSVEFLPCESFTGGYEVNISPDVGFRCVAPVYDSFYDE